MKTFYKSKTLWFTLLTFLLAVAGYFGFEAFVMPPELAGWYNLLLPVIFALLRVVTKKEITLKSGAK